MKTFTVLIGNSDNKLSQQSWHDFYHATDRTVRRAAQHIHFEGTSASAAKYQNAAWVFEMKQEAEDFEGVTFDFLRRELASLAFLYNQDSIILTEWMVADFITPEKL